MVKKEKEKKDSLASVMVKKEKEKKDSISSVFDKEKIVKKPKDKRDSLASVIEKERTKIAKEKELKEEAEKERAKIAKEEEEEAEAKRKEATEKAAQEIPKKKSSEPFSDVFVRSFRVFRYALLLLGRIPLTQTRRGTSNYVFKGSLCSIPGLYFLLTTAILFYIFILGTWNLFVIAMEVHLLTDTFSKKEEREFIYEKIVIERHLVTLIVTWTSLIHSIITSVNFLTKREYTANYFSFWTRAVDTMYMDVAQGTMVYALIVVGSLAFAICILVAFSISKFGPATVGGPTIMFMLMFRPMLPGPWLNAENPEEEQLRTDYQIIGGMFFVFVFVSSKVYILVFLFKCKLLRNAFAIWNGRVYAAVLRGGDFTQSDRGRTTYSLLFKDHCILLDLMEGTDRLFSTIIESYFGLQVVSICCEGYFFMRSAKITGKQDEAFNDGNFFIRPNDLFPGLILLVISIFILITVSKAAAEVGEEALAGLEVIRRKTMLGRRTDEELYFMLSMFSSYTAYKKLQMSGGGYFYLDKEFIIGIVSTIFSYFIIIYQFQPYLDYKSIDTVITRCEIGKFLSNLEGLPDNHWNPKGVQAC